MTPVEVFAAHQLIPYGDRCMCGHQVGWGGTAESRERHPAHVLDALTKAGHAVVTLPEADGPDGDGQLWFNDCEIRVDTTSGLPYDVWQDGPAGRRTVRGMRLEAAALLAAAAAAETGWKA